MSQRTVIVLYPQKDGKTEISLVDPHTGRESRTGLKASDDPHLDSTVEAIKGRLEAQGNQVDVKTVPRPGDS